MNSNNEPSGIKFEEDRWKESVPSFADETPRMIQLVMKISGGAIKEQKQAEYVLLGFAVLAFIISLFLFFGGSSTRPPVSPNDLLLTPASDISPS